MKFYWDSEVITLFSVNKLNSVVDVPHIKKSVFNTMHRMKERTTAHDVGVRFV